MQFFEIPSIGSWDIAITDITERYKIALQLVGQYTNGYVYVVI